MDAKGCQLKCISIGRALSEHERSWNYIMFITVIAMQVAMDRHT